MRYQSPDHAGALRIVVTDDDPRLLATLVNILKNAHHCVFTAFNGLAALQLTEYVSALDLLITNTRLGNVDAPELIRRVRQAKPWLAILHIGDPLPAGDGPLANVPTLREPFTAEELLKAVGELTGRAARAADTARSASTSEGAGPRRRSVRDRAT
jgi:CheY-like chemotaxis protein